MMSSFPRKDKSILSADSVYIEVGRSPKKSHHHHHHHQNHNHHHKHVPQPHHDQKGKLVTSSNSLNNWKQLRENWKIRLPTIGEMITIVGWIIAIGVCGFYIGYSVINFITSLNNPTTATTYVNSVPLYYPSMTVCNWNALQECEYCSLSLEHLTRVNSATGLVENFAMEYDSVVILQHEQPFQCLVFNNRTNALLEAKDVGYSGTLTFYFKVPLVPVSRDGRFGLQISFHESGTVPNVFAETNFAIPNVDNYFAVTKVLTKRLKPTTEDGLQSVRWESELSFIELTDICDDMIVISVAYASMNLREIAEVYTSSFEGLFGQIAGMIGIFMGLDVLKFLRGILVVPYSIKHRSIRRVWDNFN